MARTTTMPLIVPLVVRCLQKFAPHLTLAATTFALLSLTSSIAVFHPLASANRQSAPPPPPLDSPRLTQGFQLTGDQLWLDTHITILPGERLLFSAIGSLRYPGAPSESSPAGLPRTFKDLLRNLPLSDAGRGALIARIGDPDIASPFLIGPARDLIAPAAGRLFVGINQSADDTADGTYNLEVTIYPRDPNSTLSLAHIVASIPAVDASLFAKIPRRVTDKSGAPGDMINFLIVGSSASVEKAFKSAGWVQVDADVKDTLINGVLATISKEAYLTMPMSQLYLFARPQDYGWAHAEPIQVVASRHHLRLWLAPFTVNGQSLWCGAATHDIGFAHDQRNSGVTSITHKIDPDIDLERDYVQKTLSNTGQVAEISHFLPLNPLHSATTATGASFHSNGQVLILKLSISPDVRQSSR
jgi:hypothetical protein